MKKLLAVLLAFAMALALLPAASAASPVWDGRSSEAYAGGTGTEDDPYLIANGAQLYQLSLDANDSSTTNSGYYAATTGIYFKLTQDIDMGNKAFPGIAYFSGTLDGAGFSIINLKIVNTASSYTGLVRQGIHCTIRNLTVAGSVTGAGYTGGIIGFSRYASCVENCTNLCLVSGSYYIGGICGFAGDWNASTMTTKVSGCANLGKISGSGGEVGGICGDSGHGLTISECANAGEISSASGSAAGILGNAYSGVRIQNCYNTGSITGTYASGITDGRSSDSYGGSASSLAKNYNCGLLNGPTQFDPTSLEGTCEYSYYLSDINTEAIHHTNAVGLASEEMTSVGSFVGFDFTNVWTWDSTGTYNYPILRSIGVVLIPCEDSNHSWNEGTVLHLATCTEEGELLVTCTKCAMAQNQPIPALGHDVLAGTAVPPTCTEDGLTAGGHCSRCDYTVAQEIDPALGHDMVADTAIPATCTESGLTAGSHCSRCEYTLPGESVPALGHDMVAGTAVPPTCTETGLTAGAKCSRCDHTEPQEIVAALGHNMIIDPAVPATCTETGLTEGSHCSRCDHRVAQQTVPALGHDMITLPGYPATCTQNGLTSGAYCSRCDRVIPQTVIPATGHSWDNGVVTTPPTEEAEGVKTYTCTVCGATKTEPIPVLDHVHSYSSVVTAPTCTEQGYTLYTCSCGHSYTGDAVPATGHDYEDGSCIHCGAEDPDWTEPEEPFVNPFIDVKENDYFYAPVLWAVGEGITNGTTPTTFSPYDPCTRGQIVTFLWRAFGSPSPKSTHNPFTDVSPNLYYYTAVLWAVEQGITTGTSATTFSPEDTCTRGQVATFLWRACGKPAPKGNGNPFSDVPQTVYYYQPILWAVENGITNGTGGGKFSPEDSCTRGQIVTFLYRALAKE